MSNQLRPLFLLSHPYSGADVLKSGFKRVKNFVDLGQSDQLGATVEEVRVTIENHDRSHSCLAMVQMDYSWFESNSISEWIGENQFPVLHLVRKNTLDCLVDAVASRTEEFPFHTETVVSRISQMRNKTKSVRELLVKFNSIEVQYENLRTISGRVSEAVVRKICGWLDMAVDDFQFELDSGKRESIRDKAEEIKLKLRPELTRSGLGDLYNLPRAA